MYNICKERSVKKKKPKTGSTIKCLTAFFWLLLGQLPNKCSENAREFAIFQWLNILLHKKKVQTLKQCVHHFHFSK